MDVNALLAILRELVNEEPQDALDCRNILDELKCNFKDLDEWLSNNGFLPRDWDRNADA